jgi:transcriptional regulator with XRE-family HTH domain
METHPPRPTLGDFLRDRRGRLRPPAQDAAGSRRRTPGLRREEVAQRAGVSVTWYTWLEQGRGGAPSADALERIARALELDRAERELLFLIAQQRPPPVTSSQTGDVSRGLQRLLDSLVTSPACVKNQAWDVLAWNAAAAAVLIDYGTLPPDERNVLRIYFLDPRVRAAVPDWEHVARGMLASFRVEVARAGPSPRVEAVIEELRRLSPEFRSFWAEHDARLFGEGVKHFNHSILGPLELDYVALSLNGPTGLSLVIYTPASERDRLAIERLVAGRRAAA